METELANYIFQYCSKFYSYKERKAYDHHFGQMKFKHFDARKDLPEPIVKVRSRFNTDDSEVLELLKDGYSSFIMKTAERIYRDHKHELKLNLCPKCNGIARTPQAQQCRFCGHDWH